MSKNKSIMNYVIKGIIIVGALITSLLLIAPFMTQTIANKTVGFNLFDAWDVGLENASADYAITIICYSIVFFLGIIIAVLALLSIFVDNSLLNKIIKFLAIILAIVVIVGLICNFVYVNANATIDIPLGGEYETGLKIGAGGIISAIAGILTTAMVFAEKSLRK